MNNFHRIFKLRLYDQYRQSFFSKLKDSNRLNVLSSLKTDFTRSDYIDKIKSPDIRKTFTRLRIDNNVLNSCKFRFNQSISKLCKTCNRNVEEGVTHFLMECDYYKEKRDAFYTIVSKNYRNFTQLSDNHKLHFILNLECADDMQGVCCKFVHDIYSIREHI